MLFREGNEPEALRCCQGGSLEQLSIAVQARVPCRGKARASGFFSLGSLEQLSIAVQARVPCRGKAREWVLLLRHLAKQVGIIKGVRVCVSRACV